MDCRQLRYFVAVAEELHFGKAAERLGIAQPPLSQQIQRFEHSIGVQLFRRSSRRVELTDAGSALLDEARLILQRIDSAKQMVQQCGDGFAGRIDIGAVSPALDTFVPRMVQHFASKRPNIRLSLHEMRSEVQIEALRSRRLDIGFIRRFRHDLDGLGVVTVRREPYVLAIPKKCPLAGRKIVRLESLKDVPFIMAPRALRPELHDCIVACCQEAGFSPNIVQEAPSKRTEVSLVAAGIGVALVPKSYVTVFPRGGVVYRAIRGRMPEIEMVAIWNTANGPSIMIDEFLGVVQSSLA